MPIRRGIPVYPTYQDKRYQAPSWSRQRARAVYLLGRVGDRKAASLLRSALRDETNLFVRGYTVQSLVQLDLPDARQLIEDRLEVEEELWVLRKIAEALGEIGTPSSVPILERHLYNERSRTRWKIREAIGEIKRRYAL